MPIFIYPVSQASIDALTDCCQSLSLPPLICWNATSLSVNLNTLITDAHSSIPHDFESAAATAGLNTEMILFSGQSRDDVMRVVNHYREAGQWPLFAVETPHSRKMTLATLIGHLLDDRQREDEVKTTRAQQPVADD